MRINPDAHLDTDSVGDLRHIRHADLGAVQVADSIGAALNSMIALSVYGLLLLIGMTLFVAAARPRVTRLPADATQLISDVRHVKESSHEEPIHVRAHPATGQSGPRVRRWSDAHPAAA